MSGRNFARSAWKNTVLRRWRGIRRLFRMFGNRIKTVSVGTRLFALALLEPLLLGVAVWTGLQVRRGFRELGDVLGPVRAVRAQLFPSFVRGGTLCLRQGLFGQADLAPEHIVTLTPGHALGARKLNVLVVPNVTLPLSTPVVLRGPWGGRRESQCLSLFVDDAAALRSLVTASASPSTL